MTAPTPKGALELAEMLEQWLYALPLAPSEARTIAAHLRRSVAVEKALQRIADCGSHPTHETWCSDLANETLRAKP